MKINACKFCGAVDVRVQNGAVHFFVVCNSCHAMGPSCTVRVKAVKQWNAVMS
jgi:hypothetical protein